MFKTQSERAARAPLRQATVAAVLFSIAATAWSQTGSPASAGAQAAAQKSLLESTKGQVSDLLELDASIAADKMRRDAGIPTLAEQRRQAAERTQETQAAVQRANLPPPPPPAPTVEAIYGVGSKLTAVVSYDGRQYEFQSGRAFALGQSGGPRLKSISGQCVTFTLAGAPRTACYHHERDLGPGATPTAYSRGGVGAPRQDSTNALPGQFGVIAPPPPFLTK
jgi:hypothetical protein